MRFRKAKAAVLLLTALGGLAQTAYAGELDILVKKLVEKKILTEDEARGIVEETKQEVAKEAAAVKTPPAPADWTQKVKITGDVRDRLQTDWGKNLGPAHQRTQNQIRARAGIEAKINEQVKAGMRVVSGTSNARSTNQTLTSVFSGKQIWFDLFYIAWFPEFRPLKDSSLWLGKFENPLEKTDLTWDRDIDPEGLAFKYLSPSFKTGSISEMNVYGNFGLFWLNEFQTAETDQMLWIWQAGIRALLNEEWGTSLDIAAAYYNPTRIPHRTLTGTAGTNTLFPSTDPQYANTLRYDYDMLDFLIQLDNKKFFDYDLPFGLWGDVIVNPSLSDKNLGFMTGGYFGSKKAKEQGEWNVYGDFQWVERDAILDVFPDQDFYGFTSTGNPVAGGTNGYGFHFGVQYRILKNTLFHFKYGWSKPIDIQEVNSQERTKDYQYIRSEILVNF
ncbi:MAG: putative porin [Candidatus Omnitrophica bacterium]|nr:putative porin [Candidatus Omnitrophota bacterium]